MKKRIIKNGLIGIVGIALCLLFVFWPSSCHDLRYYRYGMFEVAITDFNDHRGAYQVIAAKLLDALAAEKMNNPNVYAMSVRNYPNFEGKWEFMCRSSDVSNTKYEITEDATEEEVIAFNEVYNSMHSNIELGYTLIHAEDDHVLFGRTQQHYIFYDPSGNYYKQEKSKESVLVYRLYWNWYEAYRIIVDEEM